MIAVEPIEALGTLMIAGVTFFFLGLVIGLLAGKLEAAENVAKKEQK